MRVFVINLRRSPERRRHILAQCARYGLLPEIVEAMDGEALTDEALRDMTAPGALRALTRGEIACALSHLAVYRRIAAERLPVALILEDDAVFLDNPGPLLAAFEARGDRGRTVHLLSGHNSEYALRGHEEIGGRRYYHSINSALACGYVLSGTAAEALARFFPPIRFMADYWKHFERAGVIRVFCTDAPLVDTDRTFPSLLEEARRLVEQNPERRRHLKHLKREVPFFREARRIFWRLFIRPFQPRVRKDCGLPPA